MDKAIVELAESFKEHVKQLGVCMQQLCDVVLNIEQRLQEVEKPLDIKTELHYLKTYILGVEDPVKRTVALNEFEALCNALGITSLEE